MTGRARTARWRVRRLCGVQPVTVELEAGTLEALVAAGVLTEADLTDRHRLAERLGAEVSKMVRKNVTPSHYTFGTWQDET